MNLIRIKRFVRWHQLRGHQVEHLGGAFFMGVRCSCGKRRWYL